MGLRASLILAYWALAAGSRAGHGFVTIQSDSFTPRGDPKGVCRGATTGGDAAAWADALRCVHAFLARHPAGEPKAGEPCANKGR
jgi:hypothetical protein